VLVFYIPYILISFETIIHHTLINKFLWKREKMATGQLEHELELHVPASEAWELFGTLGIGKMVVEEIPQIFQKVELIEGDGGVGTILKLTFAQGRSLFFF
jgi:hypothetical protein